MYVNTEGLRKSMRMNDRRGRSYGALVPFTIHDDPSKQVRWDREALFADPFGSKKKALSPVRTYSGPGLSGSDIAVFDDGVDLALFGKFFKHVRKTMGSIGKKVRKGFKKVAPVVLPAAGLHFAGGLLGRTIGGKIGHAIVSGTKVFGKGGHLAKIAGGLLGGVRQTVAQQVQAQVQGQPEYTDESRDRINKAMAWIKGGCRVKQGTRTIETCSQYKGAADSKAYAYAVALLNQKNALQVKAPSQSGASGGNGSQSQQGRESLTAIVQSWAAQMFREAIQGGTEEDRVAAKEAAYKAKKLAERIAADETRGATEKIAELRATLRQLQDEIRSGQRNLAVAGPEYPGIPSMLPDIRQSHPMESKRPTKVVQAGPGNNQMTMIALAILAMMVLNKKG